MCRNPWAYGDKDSHLIYRYSYQQQLLSYLHTCSRLCFFGLDNVPLPRHMSATRGIRSFGSTLEPRYVFGATILDHSEDYFSAQPKTHLYFSFQTVDPK